MKKEVGSGHVLKDSSEFGFYPKCNSDSLKNLKQILTDPVCDLSRPLW
jgi:hypothetical protein